MTGDGGRSWLDVPYAEKDAAKAAGARWHPAARRWYSPNATVPDALTRWAPVPRPRAALDPAPDPVDQATPTSPPSSPTPSARSLPTVGPLDRWDDLAGRHPGQAVGREAARRRAAGDPDAWAWAQGADGEARLADALDHLVHPRGLARWTARGPGWRVLHSVPIGTRGTDIDHVLIGPPGVITINTKHHKPRVRVEVDEDEITIGGQRSSYVAKARAEADRARALLVSAAAAHTTHHALGELAPPEAAPIHGDAALLGALAGLGAGRRPDLGPGPWPPVQPVLAVVGAALHSHGRPRGVLVTTPKDLPRLLTALPAVLDRLTSDALYALARRSTTWARDV